jgi:hypothetical protein
MRRETAKELANALELQLYSAGVCLACLTFVAFPLDSGDERTARREARKLAPNLWAEGLELTTMLALETARRDGVAGAAEAVEEVRQARWRSPVVHAIVWRLAELMVEDMAKRKEVRRQREPSGASARIG